MTLHDSSQYLGDPLPQIKWEKDGNSLRSSRRLRLYQDFNSHCLEIKECDEEDSGEYVCTATNCHGASSHTVLVNVGGSLDLKHDASEVDNDSSIKDSIDNKVQEDLMVEKDSKTLADSKSNTQIEEQEYEILMDKKDTPEVDAAVKCDTKSSENSEIVEEMISKTNVQENENTQVLAEVTNDMVIECKTKDIDGEVEEKEKVSETEDADVKPFISQIVEDIKVNVDDEISISTAIQGMFIHLCMLLFRIISLSKLTANQFLLLYTLCIFCQLHFILILL